VRAGLPADSPGLLNMSTFASRNKQDWDELEKLVRRARKWSGSLSSAERERLDALYRRTTVHLARVSSRSTDQVLIDYLNHLTAAAHSIIYLPPRQSILSGIGQFVADNFPRAIARNWRPHLLSAVLLIGGALLGYFTAMADPVLCHALWPSSDPRQPGATAEQLLSQLRQGRDDSSGMKFLMSSFLFQHNLLVSVVAMGTGVLAAVPTVFLIIFNGMLLGVFAAIHHQAGIDAEMWAWILPHGITELSAITLCGGVGLMLGYAVVSPGAQSRTSSLRKAGREAATICIGAAGMLIAAALIEGYIRQTSWSTAARFTFAGSTAIFWIVYLNLGFYRERLRRSVAKPESVAAPV
jgi:uncharacterized membrane protein SpoIIM required for sporulation